MWIRYKTAEGDTPATIARKFKLKDPKVLLANPKNKGLKAQLAKRDPLPKGTVIWVPDPGARVFVTKDGGKDVVMEADKWRKTQAALNKRMDQVARSLRRQFDMAEARHDAQDAVNEEFPVVSFFTSKWFGNDVGREPVPQFRKAKAAVEKLESTVSARNYKNFEADAKAAEKAINAYRAAIGAWIKQLTGSAENWVKGLSITRDVSFTVFGAAAMTVAAPASLGATLAWGAGVGASSGFMQSAATEAGKGLAGDKLDPLQSTRNIAAAMAKGAGFGMLGAGLSRFFAKHVAGKLAEKLLSGPVAQKFALKMAMRTSWLKSLTERMMQQEIRILVHAGKLPPSAIPTFTYKLCQGDWLIRTQQQVIAKFVTRLGMGTAMKVLGAVMFGGGRKPVEDYVKANQLKLKGRMSEAQLGEKIARAVEKDPLMETAFTQIVAENKAGLEAELRKVLRAEIVAMAKKHPVPA
ncbi:hypothetical protein LNKW23_45460 [Paralimibaculum aggregatum]|uniref:LysM domain-containing protein n=1 Tax=Paralimibaculum aggregatum TaxID=3036245 RepID=A0ABQ6LTE6_9RHOB|nr:hypothetical protein [Limibaculum sp. NKW23]GMG85326.1 hypothetical protein LNKW23_45460 [Limibaculum sp. NKW23]